MAETDSSTELSTEEINIEASVVRAVIDQYAKVYRLADFFGEYLPSLPRFHVPDALSGTLVVPSASCTHLERVNPRRDQSLASLVDDVVWTLVQRRERLRQAHQDGRNLLCLGLQSDSDWAPGNDRRLAMNNNVDYCKTVFRDLHASIGDDAMRLLLLQTAVFLPQAAGNYLQLTGAPVSAKPSTNTSGQRPRKRRRSSPPVPRRLEAAAVLSRKDLFYSNTYCPRIGLPSSHLLNRDNLDIERLFSSMLGLDAKSPRFRRLRDDGTRLAAELVRRHAACDFARLLERACPLPSWCGDATVELAQAAAGYSSSSGVVAFVRGVLRRVLPPEWLGEANLDHLLDHQVPIFVSLRRQEQIANKNLTHGIRLRQIKWLYAVRRGKAPRSDHQAAERAVTGLLRWLFGEFIMPLLSACFHVTESEFAGKQVLYYRKPVWSIFRALSMRKLLRNQYREITAEEARQRLERQSMGFSRLRLLPKATGVRPIATLCKREHLRLPEPAAASSTAATLVEGTAEAIDTPFGLAVPVEAPKSRTTRNRQSTNRILNDAFSVLQYEHLRDQDSFGAGVHGLHYFYPKYRKFVVEARAEGAPLYFGSVDIQHCYDSMDQAYLLQVIDKILKQDEYIVQRYEVVHSFESIGRVFKRQKRAVSAPEDFDPVHRLVVNGLADEYHDSVFVDGVNCTAVKKTALMEELREHLTSHLVTVRGRFGDRYLLQAKGIPQGSVLSTLLCNFYYGNVEKKLLPHHFDKRKDESSSADLLVRMVDDFLLATTNLSLLHQFLEVMNRGEPSLGVSVNHEKTQLSTEVTLIDQDGSPIALGPDPDTDRSVFAWCGMLFDVQSGEVRIDYSRFADGKGGESLTVDRINNQGAKFAVALKMFVRPRCLPILFDPVINSSKTQMINFYQLHALAAVKTLEYLRSSDLEIEHNVNFVVSAIESTISYAYNLISDRVKQQDGETHVQFRRNEALWMGWRAFCDVLGRSVLGRAGRERLGQWPVREAVHLTVAEALSGMNIESLMKD